jgi:CheY-like chemotaxis protein
MEEILKDKIVLLADDDMRNVFSLTAALEQQGLKVIAASDGKEALKKLEENKTVDIILMDIMMPEMDGYEAIRQIRKQSRYKDLPILALTAKAMKGDREKCIEAGASDYISKPVNIEQLTSLMRAWLYK